MEDKEKERGSEINFVFTGELFPSSPEEELDYFRTICLADVFELIEGVQNLIEEIRSIKDQLSPVLQQKYNLKDLGDLLNNVLEIRKKVLPLETISDLEDLKYIYYAQIPEIYKAFYSLIEEKGKDYQIIQTDPVTGKKLVHLFKSKGESVNALLELKKLSQRPRVSQIRMPKDLMETQTHSVGDTLEYITNPEKRENIKKLQTKGKLLAGTLEGLSGGSAYLKSFTIALAQTLNEQSKYYKTEEDNSGVPLSLIPKLFSGKVELREESFTIQGVELREKPFTIQGREEIGGKLDKRTNPRILVSYEDLASKMRGKGKKRGGKDAVQIRDYIENLSGKQYLLDGGKGVILGVPFLTKPVSIYREDTGEEVGCLLSLSPQFSKTLRGYTGLRADTIQLIGGGRQKDITMNLLGLLLFVRGTDKGNTWKKKKKDLLDQIGGGKTYSGRPGKREEHFKEAIQKVKDSYLITDYREEKNSSGETISVFVFNPDYSKGKEAPEIQSGE